VANLGRGLSFSNFKESRLVYILTRSWVIAVLLGSVTFYLLYFQPSPYLFTITDSTSLTQDTDVARELYLDLASDGKARRYRIANMPDTTASLMVWDTPEVVRDQWNFQGSFSTGLFRNITCDHDHDGNMEICAITVDNNRIYLNIIEPFDNPSTLALNRLVDTIWTRYPNAQPSVHDAKSIDLNHDGTDELVFSFSPLYARQPRKVYAYDIKADSLWSSPLAGSSLTTLIPLDLDGDGKTEIIGNCDAPVNYTDEVIALQDSSSWFIVLDEQLNYKIPPRKMGPAFSQTAPVPYPAADGVHWFVYTGGFQNGAIIKGWYRILPDYSLRAEALPVKSEIVHLLGFYRPTYSEKGLMIRHGHNTFIINEFGEEVIGPELPGRLSVIEIYNISAGIREFEYCFFVDGRTPIISFYSLHGKLLGSIREVDYLDFISLCWTGIENDRHQLILTGKKVTHWIEVRENPMLYLQYLIWIGMIGVFYAFIELIKFSQTQELLRKEKQRKELLELQLRSLKNQLDPHFTFNALNGLSYLVISGDSARVNRFITHFSRLLRNHLYTSDKALIRLGSELEFLQNYMELQKMRFDDLIVLELYVDPDVDTNIMVPKMLLQTHVENAVKHGLRPKFNDPREKVGLVKVTIYPERESTVILIEDNGVGRGNGPLNREDSTGKGLVVLDQIITAVRQLYKLKITQEFEDLKDQDGNATGTRVRIVVG
jgi:hypothetical protein